MNHPNAFNCQVFRKTVTRTAPGTMGGLPTLGGMGVLDSEDEEQIEYTWVGNGFAVPAEQFQPSLMTDNRDANNGAANEFRFLIEPEEEVGHPEWFDLKKHDILYLLLGAAPPFAKLAFEIEELETTSNIPPYTTRYVANRRDDLHVAAGP